jgi:hypothetical protein
MSTLLVLDISPRSAQRGMAFQQCQAVDRTLSFAHVEMSPLQACYICIEGAVVSQMKSVVEQKMLTEKENTFPCAHDNKKNQHQWERCTTLYAPQ